MFTYFEFVQEKGKNFTPSTKIIEFAKKHHLEYFNRYGKTILCFISGECKYSHYEIKEIGNNMEKVTIYLENIK